MQIAILDYKKGTIVIYTVPKEDLTKGKYLFFDPSEWITNNTPYSLNDIHWMACHEEIKVINSYIVRDKKRRKNDK